MAADPEPALDVAALDLVVLLQLAGHAMTQAAQAGARARMPARYGFVLQHVVDGPRSISQIAERLGVTQQAASKTVAEMEEAGLLSRTTDPGDARVRQVVLTAAGRLVIEDARATRAELAGELEERLGPRRAAALRRGLLEALDLAGATEAVAGRRVLPLT